MTIINHQKNTEKAYRPHDLGQIGMNPWTGARFEVCSRCKKALTGHSYKVEGEKVCKACLDLDPFFFCSCGE